MAPQTSIVITAFNRQAYLAMAIQSVLYQTYSDFELIVWDDGSTDRSLDVALDFAKTDDPVRVVAGGRRGRSLALMSAISITSGAYLAWVDSDDLLEATALQETVAVLQAMPQVGLVYTQYKVIDPHNQILGLGRRCQIPFSKNPLLTEFMVFHFRLFRRSVFELAGGINPICDHLEDYDLCLRLSEITLFDHVPQPQFPALPLDPLPTVADRSVVLTG